MKDIKHIRWDFHSVAWVMPQGLDLGVPWGGVRGKETFFPKFNQIWCVSYLHESHRTTGCFDDRLLTMMTDTGFYVP